MLQLVKDGQRYGAEYRDGLSNHLPMSLIALQRMGASADQIRAFYTSYVPRLEVPEPEGKSFTQDNWRIDLGQHKYNLAYRTFFGEELTRLGRRDLLEEYLPVLMPGIAGGALHPLIRLAYALEADLDAEVVESLAALAMAYLEVGQARGGPPEEPGEGLLRLARTPELTDFEATQRTIFESMEVVAQIPAFAEFGALPPLTTLNDVREQAPRIYAGSCRDFTALHLVTGAHALRVLAKAHPEIVAKSLEGFWRAVGTAYITIGMPAPQDVTEPVDQDWATLLQEACQSPDAHVIKFVYTCHEEALFYKDPRYKTLAAARIGS